MAKVANYKIIEKGYSNQKFQFQVEHDFAKDGGAVGILELAKMGFDGVITGYYQKVKTAYTSTGAATLDVGIKTTAQTSLATAIALGTLALGAVVYDSTNQIVPLKIAKDAELSIEIKVAAYTAGKSIFVFEVEPF